MTTTDAPRRFEASASRQFAPWLRETGVSLAISTYQAGKLLFVGTNATDKLSFFERTLERVMGVCADDDGLWISTLYQLWRFDNVLDADAAYEGYDALFAPRRCYVTGDIDVHDVAIDRAGRPVFVNTLFSCLATVSDTASFAPIWRPRFITRLAAEDRCHLNGLAMADGTPAYVTAVAATDVAGAWREHRRNGGIVIDVASGEIVAADLSMPHSPRVHAGRLWLLQAGTGEFGVVDPTDGRFEPIAFVPGFARGMTFVGRYALVGLSRQREAKTFAGLALDDRLAREKVSARCGLVVIDTRTGDLVHHLTFEGMVEELYDVAVIRTARRPALVGFRSDEVRRILRVADPVPLRP